MLRVEPRRRPVHRQRQVARRQPAQHLQEAGIKAGADQLFCTSSDGFTSGTPAQTAMDGRDALLAVAMNDAALPVEHGFPARLVIPGLYGYVSACKWIVDIEVTTLRGQPGVLGAARLGSAGAGQDRVADRRADRRQSGQGRASRSRSPASRGLSTRASRQSRSASANGPWQQARLATVPGIDCWRQWVYDWPAAVRPGTYLIEARATDKTGYTQTSLQEPPEPNGASGYPSVTVNVVS